MLAPRAMGYSRSRAGGARCRTPSMLELAWKRLAPLGSKETTLALLASSMCIVHAPTLAPAAEAQARVRVQVRVRDRVRVRVSSPASTKSKGPLGKATRGRLRISVRVRVRVRRLVRRLVVRVRVRVRI